MKSSNQLPEKTDSICKTVKNASGDFADILISAERSVTIDAILDIYAPLLGNWELRIIDYYPETKTSRFRTGVWFFSRTLEGRAIQDVLVSPDFSERSDSISDIGNRYGNTFRMMDPVTRQWSVHWFNPVSGAHNHLLARVEGHRLIQETTESNDLMMQWIFEDITPDSFHWIGEHSIDLGKTWILSAEFYATRIKK